MVSNSKDQDLIKFSIIWEYEIKIIVKSQQTFSTHFFLFISYLAAPRLAFGGSKTKKQPRSPYFTNQCALPDLTRESTGASKRGRVQTPGQRINGIQIDNLPSLVEHGNLLYYFHLEKWHLKIINLYLQN